jgi:hypothetical protein
MRTRELNRWIEGSQLTVPTGMLEIGRCLTWMVIGAALACLLLR